MTEKIERLAHINCANDMIGISSELIQERNEIVQILVEAGIILLDRGITFTEDINKEIYLEAYNSF